jgi:hypothetical protein
MDFSGRRGRKGTYGEEFLGRDFARLALDEANQKQQELHEREHCSFVEEERGSQLSRPPKPDDYSAIKGQVSEQVRERSSRVIGPCLTVQSCA